MKMWTLSRFSILLTMMAFTGWNLCAATEYIRKSNKTIDYCPQGTRAYGVKMTHKVSSGEKSLLKVQFYCKAKPDNTASEDVIESNFVKHTSDHWLCSVYSRELFCPTGGFITAFQLLKTDAWLNGIRLYCSNHLFIDYAQITQGSGGYNPNDTKGKWTRVLRCPLGKTVCGLRTHKTVEAGGGGDCKGGIDQIRVTCCDAI